MLMKVVEIVDNEEVLLQRKCWEVSISCLLRLKVKGLRIYLLYELEFDLNLMLRQLAMLFCVCVNKLRWTRFLLDAPALKLIFLGWNLRANEAYNYGSNEEVCNVFQYGCCSISDRNGDFSIVPIGH